jgi:hypothetical protein
MRISNSEKMPSLSFTSCAEFRKKPDRIWPRNPSLDISSIIFENPARGCTIVMNQQCRDLVHNFQLEGIIMHDWLMLLSVQTTGRIYFGSQPEVRYRLHSQNAIGRPSIFKLSRMRRIISPTPHPAVVQFMRVMENLLIKGYVLPEFTQSVFDSFSKNKVNLLLFRMPLRMNKIEDKVYKLYLVYLISLTKIFRLKIT